MIDVCIVPNIIGDLIRKKPSEEHSLMGVKEI